MDQTAHKNAPTLSAQDEAHAKPRHSRRRRAATHASRLLVIFLVAALAATGAAAWLRYASRFETTDNAYITGDVHPISSRVTGVIEQILVNENQRVKAGETLVLLDPRDAVQKLDQAKAKLAESYAQSEQDRADIVQAEAKVAEAEANLEKARADYERAQELTKSKVIAKQAYDTAVAAFQAATATVNATRAALVSAKAKLTLTQAQIATAKTSVSDAELQLTYTHITAPVAGHIGKKSGETGMEVLPGQPLMALVEDSPWIAANFKETQLTHIQPGQKVEVAIDALADAHFNGIVESIAPASGAQFSLLPPDNATGNFTKIVQRIPVKIVFDPESLRGFEGRIVPGMSTLVKVWVKP